MDTPTLAETAHPPFFADLPVATPAAEAHELALSRLVSQVFDEARPPLRARLLECLLRPVRPLGLVAVAAGAFSGFLHRKHWTHFRVPLTDTMCFTAEQVAQLARFVVQVQPEALHKMADVLANHPACLETLSGSLLLMALSQWHPACAVGRV